MHWKTKKHTIEAWVSVGAILALAASVLSFAGDAQARGRRHRATAPPAGSPQSEAAKKADVGGKKEGSDSKSEDSKKADGGEKPEGEASRKADVGGKPEGSASNPSPAAAALADIKVSFKLDPRLTQSLDLGERWVSPATHPGAREGKFTVAARADVLDAQGKPMDISLEWLPADPGMVAVSPRQGNEVQITVQSAGQSNLKVTSPKGSKELSIMAWYQDDAIRVEISQRP